MNLLLGGEKLEGRPAARVDARCSSVVSTPSTPMSTLNGGDSFKKSEAPDEEFEVLKRIVPMPRPPPPSPYDPLAEEMGESTVQIRNPSNTMPALVPSKHYPVADIEFAIGATSETPDLVYLRTHECVTNCPEGCKLGGGKRNKGKERAVEEDDFDPETMEGELNESDPPRRINFTSYEDPDPTAEEILLDIISKMGDWAVIERHRAQDVAETGAISTYGVPISLNRHQHTLFHEILQRSIR